MVVKATNRFAPVVASVAIQLCLGIAYVWSLFQTGIANTIFGGDNASAGLTFSLLLLALAFGSIVGGKLAAKYSTRAVVVLGGVVLSSGFFMASLSSPDYPWLLWLTYGVMGGFGMGLTYSTTIACAQQWFPEHKGLITGIIVSALGLGGVVFTPIIENLIQYFGGTELGELQTFRVLSILFLVVCSVGAIFLKNPPADFNLTGSKGGSGAANIPKVKDYSLVEMIKTPKFYLLAGTLMFACMGGLMMIGFAKPIAVAKGLASTATIGVLIISMCNSLGRLFWGMFSDKMGRENTIIILLIGTVISSLLVNMASGYMVYALIALIGFLYGGFLSVFPPLTAEVFGSKNVATNYGVVLFGFGVGAVASSFIAGHYKNIAVDNIDLMFPAFVIASVCAIIGIVLMLILKKINKRGVALK